MFLIMFKESNLVILKCMGGGHCCVESSSSSSSSSSSASTVFWLLYGAVKVNHRLSLFNDQCVFG